MLVIKNIFQKINMLNNGLVFQLMRYGRMKPARDKYILNRHPLIEANMSRQDCINYLNKNKIPLPEKSACIICPFHDDKLLAFYEN